jgi:hypothetical protein
MSIEPRHLNNVAYREHIELLHASTSRSMYRKQDGPCQTKPDEADDTNNLEVSEEEEAIKRTVVEDEGI